MQKLPVDADVLVAGGGLTGPVLAALLGRAGFAVILLDAALGQADAGATIDPRTLAITPASRRILKRAGVFALLPSDRIGIFRRIEVWDAEGGGRIEFDCLDLGEPELGYIIELPILAGALVTTLTTLPQARVIRPATIRALEFTVDHVQAVLADGRRITAKLIVAADGADSPVRALAGIGHLVENYPQRAVACVVETERPHAQAAYQRFLPGGPLAFLPMAAPRQCGIVWSTATHEAERLLALEDGQFCAELTGAFANHLGMVRAAGLRRGFPLQKAQAAQYCRPRLALIGDAAHSVHVLAGQGANLGLLDAAALAETLIAARARGRDPGDYGVLRRYERWRRGENRLMMEALDLLNRLFLSRQPAIRWLRSFGLDLTDAALPVKRWIMRRAMGLAGDLPAFARAETKLGAEY